MSDALLKGGPQDGKRIAAAGSAITVAYAKPIPITILEPRPSWWRHPIRWFRWRPPPLPPMPQTMQLTYRDTGRVSDDARIFEIDGDWAWYRGPVIEDTGDDYRALTVAMGAVHPIIRQDHRTRWVMGLSWYKRLRAMAMSPTGAGPDEDDPDEWEPDPHDCVLGIPVTVTNDGGAPYLENRAYPADF